MSWSNWVYLGVGLGLGIGSHWLFRRLKALSVSSATPQSEAKFDVPALLSQLKQTQLAYQLAHQMSQWKAGFLVRTSHELRSPLNSLIGLHQLILSDLCDDPAEERKFVAQAQESALKLVKLLDDILNVARTEHGTNQLDIQPLQLTLVLQEVYQLTHLLAENRSFHLVLSPPDPEIYVLADPRCLRQVVVNLIDTCITQMDAGSICLSAQAQLATASVEIWIDVQLPVSIWSESIDLMQSEQKLMQPVNQNTALSPGLSLLLNQIVLEMSKSRLEIISVGGDEDESHFTRIQLTIPLVTPEAAFLE